MGSELWLEGGDVKMGKALMAETPRKGRGTTVQVNSAAVKGPVHIKGEYNPYNRRGVPTSGAMPPKGSKS